MKLIKANKRHFNIVWDLLKELDLPHLDCYWSSEISVRWYIKQKNTYLLKVKNKYVGLITFTYEENYLVISNLVITKNYRHKGYGEYLINFSKQKMNKKKLNGIALATMLQYRVTKFYLKTGFKKTGRDYYCNRAYNRYFLKSIKA